MNPQEWSASVKDRALELGFGSAGITDLAPNQHADALTRWLRNGMGGTMTYLNRQAAKRREPARILPGATRAVLVTRDYYQPDPAPSRGSGLVAKYARGADYHRVLAEPLDQLAQFIISLGPPGTIARTYVDAGPVPERELAQRAGLGWIGKNTMLISPQNGSFFFLGAILTSLDLAVDQPFEHDRCGSCRRCIDACPTQAFAAERVLDSRRCISYLTIEYKGEIETGLAAAMENHVFGCDVCQDVCPWNHSFAATLADRDPGADPSAAMIDLEELATMTDDEFQRRFGDTPLERPGPSRMRRNAAIAQANAKAPA